MSSDSYPFIHCLDPQNVYNKYISTDLECGCGKCIACLLRHGSHLSRLCDIQEEDSVFCMFVTLTFANDCITTVQPFIVDFGTDKQRLLFRVNQPERWNTDYIHEDFLLQDDQLDYLHDVKLDKDLSFAGKFCDKFNMEGDIPLLCKTDLQKFFKRFRYYCKQYGIYEKIKYFAVGEYGPEHFRPHFHVLFYFDDRLLFLRFKEILYKSWRFGRIDFSRSRGKCSGYLSKYLNSTVSIPRLLKAKVCKPFYIHSSHFASSFYESKREEIYKSDIRRLVEHVRKLGNHDECISPWRNLAFSLFPKVRGFVKSDYFTLYRLYTAYPFAVKVFGDLPLGDLCSKVSASHIEYFSPLLFDLIGNVRCPRTFDQIYHDLYVSKHFFNFCCYGDWSYTCSRIRLIQEFYKFQALRQLRDFYQLQVDNPHLDYRYFYDGFPEFNRKKLLEFKTFRSSVSLREYKSIKHKKLNDLNKLFVDYD